MAVVIAVRGEQRCILFVYKALPDKLPDYLKIKITLHQVPILALEEHHIHTEISESGFKTLCTSQVEQ